MGQKGNWGCLGWLKRLDGRQQLPKPGLAGPEFFQTPALSLDNFGGSPTYEFPVL